MSFSKKVETNSGGGVTGEQWDVWNESQWNLLDVNSQKLANGKEVKELESIGILNFIMEIGCQPQEDASMKSNLPVPADGEDNSPEELAKMKEYPTNYFTWVDKWKDGTKTQERHVHWPVEPTEELVLAVDFPSIKVNYGDHPASDGTEDIKPLRVDYNNKWKQAFQRTVTNEVNWKTNKFGDKDIKYKITSAVGNLEEYQNDGHDLAHLVQATCNWTIKMTKNVTENGTYYTTEIKDPAPIQDIKVRKDTYTVAEQLEDSACDVKFCGILFNGGDYTKENLVQVRDFWWVKAQQAVEFDKNKGTTRDGEWLKGCNWKDSDLFKAYEEFDLGSKTKGSGGSKPAGSSEEKVKDEPKQVPKEPVKAPVEPTMPTMDFDDTIPF